MFDDLFTKDDFSFEEEEEEKELELETSDDEEDEEDPFECDHDPKDTCGPECDGTCDPDDCECDGTCDPDDCSCGVCDGSGAIDKSVWDTGYRKPPIPKKVWKPKTWKT